MENQKGTSLFKNKPLLLIGGGLVVLILTLLFLTFRNQLQNSDQNFGNTVPTGSTEVNNQTVSPTLYPFPKQYKSDVIPSTIYDEATEKYAQSGNLKTNQHAIFYVTRFYIYKDILAENNIPYTLPTSINLAVIEQHMPVMHKLVESRLVSKTTGGEVALRKYNTIDQLLEERYQYFKY